MTYEISLIVLVDTFGLRFQPFLHKHSQALLPGNLNNPEGELAPIWRQLEILYIGNGDCGVPSRHVSGCPGCPGYTWFQQGPESSRKPKPGESRRGHGEGNSVKWCCFLEREKDKEVFLLKTCCFACKALPNSNTL